MDGEYQLPEYLNFELESVLPKEFRGYILRGASVLSATSTVGSMVVQTFEQPLFTIRFKFHEFLEPIRIIFHQKSARLVSILAIKNSLHYLLEQTDSLKLRQRQFALLECHEQDIIAHYDKGKKYESLEVSWSDEIIKEAAAYFKVLEEVSREDIKETSFIVKPPHTAGEDVLNVVQQILHCKFDETQATLYLQYKIREYLLFLLKEARKEPAKDVHLTAAEWQRIDDIALILKNEPAKKFPIPGLVIRAQMNSMKLKMAFKERYGMGIFEYQLAERFNTALRLLQETNMPVKEISSLTGYKISTSFMTKFREHFGFYVTDVKRNMK